MNFNFPLLIKGPLAVIGNISNEDQLSYLNEKEVDKYGFENVTFIDSSGYEYEILSFDKKNISNLPFKKFLKIIFKNFGGHYLDSKKNKGVWVEFNLSSPRKRNLDEIKKELTDLFLKNPQWFKNSDFSPAQAIELFINEARTVKELIENISVWS